MGNLRFLDVRGRGLRITIWGGERFRTLLGKFYSPIIDSPELPQMSKKGLSLGTHATQTQVIHTDRYTDINKHKMPCVLAKILLGFFTSFKDTFTQVKHSDKSPRVFVNPFLVISRSQESSCFLRVCVSTLLVKVPPYHK